MANAAKVPATLATLMEREGITIDDLYRDIGKVNRLKTRLKHSLRADRELRQMDRDAKAGLVAGVLPRVVSDAEVLGIE